MTSPVTRSMSKKSIPQNESGIPSSSTSHDVHDRLQNELGHGPDIHDKMDEDDAQTYLTAN